MRHFASPINTRQLTAAAVVGAAYAAITILIAPIAYGPVQFRLSEAFNILPFFMPVTAWGLFIGCAIANLMSAAGLPDIIFGSLATLLSALCIARIGRSYREEGMQGAPSIGSCAAVCAMPVVFNGPIIGVMLAVMLTPESILNGSLIFGAQVALGEAAVMAALGLPLMAAVARLSLVKKFA